MNTPLRLLLPLCLYAAVAQAHVEQTPDAGQAAAAPAELAAHYAVRNVRLVDPRTSQITEDGFVEVNQGRIVALGSMQDAGLDENVPRIDGAGQTLIPGLILVHEHLFYADHPEPVYIVREQPVAFPRMYLAGGVTTMRTGGSVEPYTDAAVAAGVRDGSLIGPEILLTTPLVTSPGDMVFQAVSFEEPAAVTAFIEYWADQGFSSVKLYMSATPALVGATVAAAHKRNMQVTGHLCATSYAEAAAAGIDNLEHGFGATTDLLAERTPDRCTQADAATLARMNPDNAPERALIDTLIKNKVTLTSTLAVFESFAAGLPSLDARSAALMSPGTLALYRARKADLDSRAPDNHWAAALSSMQAMELAFYRAGGRLVAGTDPTGVGRVLPGPGSQRTLTLLQDAGLTPMEVLRIASADAAAFLGIEQRTGALAPGLEADFVLVDGRPDEDIAALANIHSVFSNGKRYLAQELYDSAAALVGGNRYHKPARPDPNPPPKKPSGHTLTAPPTES